MIMEKNERPVFKLGVGSHGWVDITPATVEEIERKSQGLGGYIAYRYLIMHWERCSMTEVIDAIRVYAEGQAVERIKTKDAS